MKKVFLALVLTVLAVPAYSALSISSDKQGHSGRTDSAGCHYNRKTGVYHCH